MTVEVADHATVRDAVGFACLEYTRASRRPPLRPDADSYALYMAEQDGSIDVEFPALDMAEPLSKYGFELLGYV